MIHTHIGRSWNGTRLEDNCLCGKALCGLVDSDLIHHDCPQHAMAAARTLRQIFPAESCPRCAALQVTST